MIRRPLLLTLALIFLSIGQVSAQKFWGMIESGLYSLEEIQQEADAYWSVHDTGKGSGYKQYKRWEWNAIQSADENGLLHRNDHSYEKVREYQHAVEAKGIDLPESGNTTGNWEELGPVFRNPTSSWNPGVGRIECISVDPNDKQHILAGAETGGAWVTHDEGGTWTPLMDDFSTMHTTAVTISPTDSKVYFVGTGSGLFRSTDGGQTLLSTSITIGKVVRVIINPSNSNIVLVASSFGIYRSTNGGQNFTQVQSGGFIDLLFKPNDPNTVYAINNSGFFKSTNGGQSFSQVTAGVINSGKGRIAVTPASPNLVYYMQGSGDSYGRLYKSTNSGVSFSVVNSSSTDMWNGYGWYGIDMAVSDVDPDLVYLGGMELYRSTNGGSSFSLHAPWSYGSNKIKYIHADIHSLEYAHGHLYTGTDGGISIDENNGATFHDLTTGMGIRQFYDITVSKNDPNAVNGGAQDNGTAVMLGNNHTWYEYLGADGMQGFVDWNNSNNLVGTTQNGGLNRSTNGGQSYAGFSTPPGEQGAWVTPVVQDPQDSRYFYVGYREVYKYTFSTGDYVRVSNLWDGAKCNLLEVAQTNNKIMFVAKGSKLFKTTDGGTNFNQLSGTSGTINDINIHPTNPNRVAVVTSTKVYVSNDGGATWTDIWGNLPFLSAYSVLLQDNPSNGIYVGMYSGVYYKDDNLTDWIPFSKDLPNVQVKELEMNYVNNKIYVGTYGRGLWWSDCYGAEEVERNIAVLGLSYSGSACSGSITPSVEVKTLGTEKLTDFVAKIYVDGTLKSTQNISTNMQKGEVKTFALQAVAVSAGQLLKVVLEFPNGDIDQLADNNDKEISLLADEVPISDMALVSFSSDDNNASNASFDNDPNTMWHNQWQPSEVAMPHELVYDLGKRYEVSGVRMLNRQNYSNGYLKDVEFYISEDGQDWGTAEAVVFENTKQYQNKVLSGKAGRYVKVKILSNIYGTKTASIAEIRFSGCEQNDVLRASITAPQDGDAFDEGTAVKVVTDVTPTLGETITKVEFLVDGIVVGTVTNSPWEYTFQNLSVGTRKLTVVAYETGGNKVTSNEVSIQINEVFNYDLAVKNLKVTTPAQCGNTVDFSFSLQNLGVMDLQDYDLEVYLNGVLQSTSNNTQQLASGANVKVDVSGIAVTQSGSNDLKVVVKMPNGNADEQPNDNEATKSFNISLGEAHQFVIATRSENPSMTFEILDNGNVVLDQADATKSTSGSNTVYDFCLVDGCYDLKVTDAFQSANCSATAWQSGVEYCGGTQVAYNGKLYESEWCNKNNPESGQYNGWTLVGNCNISYDNDTYQLLDKDAKQLAQSDVAGYTSPKTEAFCTGSQTAVTADFSANQTSVFSCSDVTFTANTSGTVTSYAWDFGADATPATATGIGPHTVSYSTTGQKTVSLTVNGNVTETKSNYVMVSQDQSRKPSLTVGYDATEICAGGQIVASVSNVQYGGSNPQFRWRVNGQVVANNGNQTYTFINLNDGDKLRVTLVSDEECLVNQNASTSNQTIKVNTSVTPSISIVADNSTICSGDVVNFTATSNGGTIAWKLNGQSVGTGSTYQSSSFQDGDKVSAVLTSNSSCASQSTATSNVETISVNASVTPSISIVADNSTICSGDVVSFTATSNGGTIAWKLNGQSVGTGSIYQSSSLQDGDKVSAVLTSNSSCASQSTVTSNVETISVNASVTPTISIMADNSTICSGDVVNFTATSSGGTIDWKLNGQSVGTGSTYQSSSLQDGDKVSAVLTSNSTCASQSTATSNVERISVNAVSSPSISIVASKSSICEGEAINYVATASSGSITWKVNGAEAGNGTSFNFSNLVDGDIVMAELTSDEACPAQAVVASNQEQVLANKPLNPSVEVELDNGTFFPACKGTQVDFTAKVYDEGTSPSFYWKVDNVVVATGATYSTSSLKDGQQVICEMIVSESCVVSSKVASPAVQAEVLDANDSQCITYTEEETFVDLRIYPNPVHDILNVEGLEADTEVFLYSAQGVQLYQGKAGQIDMMEMPAGVYMLKIQYGNRVEIKEIIHD